MNTIKTYKEITPLEALGLLVENKGEPVEGLAFKGGFTGARWRLGPLEFVAPKHINPFVTKKCAAHQCAKVTEIDPCKAPEGLPDLEPWMAFIGTIPTHFEAQLDQLYTPRSHQKRWGKLGIKVSAGFRGMLFAIDVRTKWAQEHFPEHCEIRKYKGSFDECRDLARKFLQTAGGYKPVVPAVDLNDYVSKKDLSEWLSETREDPQITDDVGVRTHLAQQAGVTYRGY